MGFQKLERLDSKGKVISEGVVSKHSPLTSSKNDGIYDVIAEDLEVLKEQLDNFHIDITKDDITTIVSAKEDIQKQISKALTSLQLARTTAKNEAMRATSAADRAEVYYTDTKRVTDSANSQIEQMKSLIEAMSNFTEAYRQLTGMDSLSNGNVGAAITFHDTDHNPLSAIRVSPEGDIYTTGKLHADLVGTVDNSTHADDAKRLERPVKINGVEFDGSKDIDVEAGMMEKKSLLVTLQPKLWNSQKEYRIENELLTDKTDIIMEPEVGTSETVYDLIADAHIVCKEQGEGYFIIKCLRDIPDQSVNVRFLFL